MEKFVEKVVVLHPHLQSLLLPDEANPPPPLEPMTMCRRGVSVDDVTQHRAPGAAKRATLCIPQTAEVEIDDVVLRRNVLLVAIRHTNRLIGVQ